MIVIMIILTIMLLLHVFLMLIIICPVNLMNTGFPLKPFNVQMMCSALSHSGGNIS